MTTPDAVLERLGRQLDPAEVGLLASVLGDLAEAADTILGETLAGVYLTVPSPSARETSTRTWTSSSRPTTPWLYVDNGSRDMEWSTHDNTEVFRWLLHHRAITVHGLDAAALIEEVPPGVLRRSAAELAIARMQDIAAEPDYLRNGWGQPHEVLTRCRLLFTATWAEVVGKTEAALWCRSVVPQEWHDLIDRAIADRPDPTRRVQQQADPVLATRTWEFDELMAPLIARAASAG